MNDLQKELQDLKAKVAELESRIVAEPVKKWEPKGGASWVNGTGEIIPSFSEDNARLFGAERETKEQAERAAVEMRRFNRLLALRDELCGDEMADVYSKSEKYCLFYAHSTKEWGYTDNTLMTLTPYFTTEESAQRACDMLNSGEVEL